MKSQSQVDNGGFNCLSQPIQSSAPHSKSKKQASKATDVVKIKDDVPQEQEPQEDEVMEDQESADDKNQPDDQIVDEVLMEELQVEI